MADVTNELMYELLKRVHHQVSDLKTDVSELKSELNSIRGHMVSMQNDIHNIYGILGRHDVRLDRIESRLELREMAEPTPPYDHHG